MEHIHATIFQIHAKLPLRRDYQPGAKSTSWKHALTYDEQTIVNNPRTSNLLPGRARRRFSNKPPLSRASTVHRQLLSSTSGTPRAVCSKSLSSPSNVIDNSFHDDDASLECPKKKHSVSFSDPITKKIQNFLYRLYV